MKTISFVNFWTRLAANLLFLFAVFVLLLFGVGGDQWDNGFWFSVPFFVWSFCLNYKANHVGVIRGH